MRARCKVYNALKMQNPVCLKLWTGDSSPSLKILLVSLKSWVDQKIGGSRRLEPVSRTHRRGAAQPRSLYTRTLGRLLLAADLTSKYASSFSCFLAALERGVM